MLILCASYEVLTVLPSEKSNPTNNVTMYRCKMLTKQTIYKMALLCMDTEQISSYYCQQRINGGWIKS
jgi:hypothetical protein